MPRGDADYTRLAAALRDTTPRCADDWRYVEDEHAIDAADQAEMRRLCRTCPLGGLCAGYARKARPTAGMWAGTYYRQRSES